MAKNVVFRVKNLMLGVRGASSSGEKKPRWDWVSCSRHTPHRRELEAADRRWGHPKHHRSELDDIWENIFLRFCDSEILIFESP